MEIDKYLEEKRQVIESKLDQYLPNKNTPPETIHEAMRYSVFAGGKRLRPILTIATANFFECAEEQILPYACAIELIHTYSLVHDDLPALDNDHLRRGKATNHVVYGEDMAILTGDALLNYAFELMLSSATEQHPNAIFAVNEIAKASGTRGMIGGQVVDVQMEKLNSIDIDTVDFIHKHKTGALFTACIRAGALLGNATKAELQDMTDYAQNLGLAFQLVDDVLDIKGDENKLGKTVGKDEQSQKATYPSLLGIKETESYINKLYKNALVAVEKYGNKSELLIQLADKVVNRDR